MHDKNVKYDLKKYSDFDLTYNIDYTIIKKNLEYFYDLESSERKDKEKKKWKLDLRNHFLENVLRENKVTLLDIGAGTGNDSLFFSENGLTVTAIDISKEMIKVCKSKSLSAMLLDYYELTKLNQKFDCIWAMNSLLHTPKKDMLHVLNQIENVLNYNGLFYLGVYGGENCEWFEKNDQYNVSRFFSEYSNDDLKEILSQVFNIILFEELDVNLKVKFQSVLLRKKQV